MFVIPCQGHRLLSTEKAVSTCKLRWGKNLIFTSTGNVCPCLHLSEAKLSSPDLGWIYLFNCNSASLLEWSLPFSANYRELLILEFLPFTLRRKIFDSPALATAKLLKIKELKTNVLIVFWKVPATSTHHAIL